jgi:hypothetical protein
MGLFSKPKVVLWPKSKSVEIYFSKKENNFFSLDIDLWTVKSAKDIETLSTFLNQNKITSISVLIPDNIVITKSFVYDSKIESIDVKEVIGLASNAVDFKIDPDFINYSLIQGEEKTIINTLIYNKTKFETLKTNLDLLGIQVNAFIPVSASISNVFSKIFLSEFFLIYPLNNSEYTLLLSQINQVYLTTNFKKSNLDIQKTVNYAQFYFSTPVKKIYHPEDKDLEIITSTEMEKTSYNESQIAQNFNYPANLPIPVIGAISDIIKAPKDNSLNKKPKMSNKKNLLPIIAVAIFAFLLVSFLVYFFFNKNKQDEIIDSTQNNQEVVSEIQPTATQIPTPTVAEIDKDIKIQVLNGTEVNGQAAALKAKLVNLGFEDVSTGNTSANVKQNSAQVKDEVYSAYFESMLGDYFVDAEYTVDLKTTSNYDVVFTIGTDLSKSSVVEKITPTTEPNEPTLVEE